MYTHKQNNVREKAEKLDSSHIFWEGGGVWESLYSQ